MMRAYREPPATSHGRIPLSIDEATIPVERTMKHLLAISTLAAALLAAAPAAFAQSLPPPLPNLSAEQSDTVKQRMEDYQRITDARVARGEISADEAVRLMQWREWQIAQQVAGAAQVQPNADAQTQAIPGAQPPMSYDSPPPAYYEERP